MVKNLKQGHILKKHTLSCKYLTEHELNSSKEENVELRKLQKNTIYEMSSINKELDSIKEENIKL